MWVFLMMWWLLVGVVAPLFFNTIVALAGIFLAYADTVARLLLAAVPVLFLSCWFYSMMDDDEDDEFL